MNGFDMEPVLSAKEKSLLRKNWLRWVFLVAACLFFTWFYGGFLSYTMLYLVLLLPAVSLAALVVNLLTFRIGETLNERSFIKGDKAMYRLVLGNESPLPIPYAAVTMYMEGQILCSEMKSLYLSLGPFARKTYAYGMPLPYRGRYSIGVHSVVFRDFLGLFFLRHKPLERKSILVRPRIRVQPHRRVPAAMVSEGNELAGLFEPGNDEMVDIRQYRPGDSLRKMHWKLTAKLGNPMVRDMRNELDNDILLVLNVCANGEQSGESLQLEDCLVEECVSQTQYLLSRSLPARLCFWRDEPVVLRAIAPGDFMKAYELLSEVKFNGTGRFEDILDNFLDTGLHRSLVYLFTVSLSHGLIEKIIALRHRGYDMEVFYLLSPEGLPLDKPMMTSGSSPAGSARESSLSELLDRNGIRAHRLTPDAPMTGTEGGRLIAPDEQVG